MSLGFRCYTANNLISYGLREASYPLDFVRTPDFEDVVRLFLLDWKAYSQQDFWENLEAGSRVIYISRYYSSIRATHWCDTQLGLLADPLPAVLEMMERRIDRLRARMRSPRGVVFLRHEPFPPENLVELASLLVEVTESPIIIVIPSHFRDFYDNSAALLSGVFLLYNSEDLVDGTTEKPPWKAEEIRIRQIVAQMPVGPWTRSPDAAKIPDEFVDGIREKRGNLVELPQDFDADSYRAMNGDLQELNDLEASIHYVRDGVREARRYRADLTFSSLHLPTSTPTTN